MRVCVFGATGTIGRATVAALLARGHEVVAVVRNRTSVDFPGADVRQLDAFDRGNLSRAVFSGETPDAVISCLASRTGVPADAWAIDHAANLAILAAAQGAGTKHFVLLSAICVQ